MNFIKSPRFTSLLPWSIWACGGLFYCYQFILRVSPSVMANDLMRAFQVNSCALGIMSAFYYYAYDSLQIPLGFIMDRFGPRKVLTFSALLCVFGSFLFASAISLPFASVGRLMMGAGSACAFIGSLKLATLWFPPQRVGRVIGLTMVLGTIGATSGGAPLALLLEYISWRSSFLLIGGIGFVLTILIWLIVRDEKDATLKAAVSISTNDLWKSFSSVLCMRQVWLIAIYSSLMYVPLSAFADLWGVSYLSALYPIDRKAAASAVAMIFLGIAVASPITTYLSDYFQTRRYPMIIGAICSTVLYAVIIFAPVSLVFMYILLFLAGVSFTGQLLGFAAICEIVPPSTSGLTLGFTNMAVMLSGVIFQPFIGWALDKIWDGRLSQGIPYYTLMNWKIAMASIPACLLVALLLTFFIQETFARNN